MNALAVQNPRHKCDWVTRTITDKKINNCGQYLTIIIIIILRLYYMCVCVCYIQLKFQYYYIIPSITAQSEKTVLWLQSHA